jgi:hypothetical protein
VVSYYLSNHNSVYIFSCKIHALRSTIYLTPIEIKVLRFGNTSVTFVVTTSLKHFISDFASLQRIII